MRTTKRSDPKRHRRYGAACASALIAFATGCGADDGKDLKAELLSVQRGFHASLLAPDRTSMPQFACQEFLSVAGGPSTYSPADILEFTNVVRDDTATARADMRWQTKSSRSPYQSRVYFTKEDGAWKWCGRTGDQPWMP